MPTAASARFPMSSILSSVSLLFNDASRRPRRGLSYIQAFFSTYIEHSSYSGSGGSLQSLPPHSLMHEKLVRSRPGEQGRACKYITNPQVAA